MRKKRGILSSFLLMALAASAPPAAEARDIELPNYASGLTDTAFQLGELDQVNLFNGNLMLTLPIGQAYPVGGDLSYGLTLVYNSSVWRLQEIFGVGGDSEGLAAFPKGNAGIGWTVSLGSLEHDDVAPPDVNTWIYVSPDGAEHAFYQTLHPDDDTDDAATTYYTRDNTYMRLEVSHTPCGPSDICSAELEMAGGTVHHFTQTAAEPGGPFRLYRIDDAWDNFLQITHDEAHRPIELTDSHGRLHTIAYTADGQVDRIELAAFGGTSATWDFEYEPLTIDRHCSDTWVGTPETLDTSALVALEAPDGSRYEMLESDGLTAAYYTSCDGAPGAGAPGVLRGLKLPTGGRVDWSHVEHDLPKQGGNPDLFPPALALSRAAYSDAAGQPLGEWSYAYTAEVPGLADTARTEVTAPSGHCTEHSFSTEPVTGAFGGWSFGLPFTYAEPLDLWETILYLSRRTFDGPCSGDPLRSEYLRYSKDKLPDPPRTTLVDLNRRVQHRRTLFHEDPDGAGGEHYRETEWDFFDGLGHYDKTHHKASFGGEMKETTLTREYNEARGDYEVPRGQSPNFEMLEDEEPWVIQRYAEEFASNLGSARVGEEFCWDDAGFLLRRRRFIDDGPKPHDIIEVYTADSSGNRATATYYGGHVQGVDDDLEVHPCELGLPADPQYEIQHEYAGGTLERSAFLAELGEPFLQTLDRDIDVSTGLVSASRDAAGVETVFTYDGLGRPTEARPGPGFATGSRTLFEYHPALGAAPASFSMREVSLDGTETFSEALFQFDALGRLWREQRTLPGRVTSARETRYTLEGWPTSVSVWGDASSRTLYEEHDPFGRPGRIVPPDGSQHEILLDYTGVRQVDRTVQVQTAVGLSSQTTSEGYDFFGRLQWVTEASGEDGELQTTRYVYAGLCT